MYCDTSNASPVHPVTFNVCGKLVRIYDNGNCENMNKRWPFILFKANVNLLNFTLFGRQMLLQVSCGRTFQIMYCILYCKDFYCRGCKRQIIDVQREFVVLFQKACCKLSSTVCYLGCSPCILDSEDVRNRLLLPLQTSEKVYYHICDFHIY